MKKLITLTLTGLMGLVFIHSLLISAAYGISQPLMEKSKVELETAKMSKADKEKLLHLNLAKGHLKNAAKNKGGFRGWAIVRINKAINRIKQRQTAGANRFINLAIKDVKKGIAYADRNNTESQPSMRKSIPLLNKAKELSVEEGKMLQLTTARIFLLAGANDKGGHRVKAIEKLDEAIIKINRKDLPGGHKLLDEAVGHIYQGICHAGY